MFVKPEQGLLYFLLYKSTHVVNAYKQGKDIVVSTLENSSGDLSPSHLEFYGYNIKLVFVTNETLHGL